jgi:ribonucleotide monophosphatase NagD (HAD superfamily)
MLDAGPFVVALEYAAGVEATVLGKPAKDFFLSAVASLGCRPEETVLVGDDAASDVGGALKAGLRGILVRTGKYRPGDEEKMGEGGIALTDAGAAAEWILERNQGRA